MRHLLFLASLLLAFALVPSTAAASEAPPSSTWKPDTKLIIGGAVGFTGSYGLALLVRPSTCHGDARLCQSARDNLVIPFAGPILHAVELAKTPLPPPLDLLPSALLPQRVWRWIGVGLIAADGLAQITSVGLLIAGVAHRAETKKPTGVAITPVLQPSYVGLEGTF